MPLCKLPNHLTVCSFYDNKDMPWYGLANYSIDKILLRDPLLGQSILWPTAEHYFQAQKISHPLIRAKFIKDMAAKGPDECKRKSINIRPIIRIGISEKRKSCWMY